MWRGPKGKELRVRSRAAASFGVFVLQGLAPLVHGTMRSIAYGFEALLVVALLPRVVKEVRAEWTQPEQPRAFTRRGLALTYAATFVFFLGLFLLTVGAAVWGRGPNPPASAPHGPLLVLLPVLGAVVMTLVMAGIRWLGWVRYRRHQQGLAGPA